jgi:hypothetical protein
MLKFSHTDNGFHLELLPQSLEDWVNTRVILALRAATPIIIQPSSASFLLPVDLPYLAELAEAIDEEMVELLEADTEFVEAIIEGTWITSDAESEEGIFVTAMNYEAEFCLYKVWLEAQESASVK